MQRALISAYAFSPTLGSEFAQGWNYVQEMKSRYKLTVLVGSSDGRMGDFSLLDQQLVTNLADEVEIIRTQPDWLCRVIKWLDVSLGMSWLFVLGLRRWHWLAYKQAAALHPQRRFDVVHQLGPIGFRNPGYLYKLGIPSYWGPIGGFQYIDLRLAFRSSARYGVVSIIRNISTFMAVRSSYVTSAVKGFNKLSFATVTNRNNFAVLHKVNGRVLSDQATVAGAQHQDKTSKRHEYPLRAIWCGSIDARKNIRLLLDVAATLQACQTPVLITVIGSGPLLAGAVKRTEKLRLTNIRFTGQIPRQEVKQHFKEAHILCFTSLSEANTSTFFEALEADCVPIALDLDGFSSNITSAIGYKISTKPGWAGIVEEYAQKLKLLVNDPALLARHVEAIRRESSQFNWETLAGKHYEILQSLRLHPGQNVQTSAEPEHKQMSAT